MPAPPTHTHTHPHTHPRTPTPTHTHTHARTRAALTHTPHTLTHNCCDHDTDRLLDPHKGGPQNGVHFWSQNRPPKRCPPTVGGTYFGGSKMGPKSGTHFGAVYRSLRIEISGRLYLHVTTKQRSNGSLGRLSMQEALLCVSGKPEKAGGPVINSM